MHVQKIFLLEIDKMQQCYFGCSETKLWRSTWVKKGFWLSKSGIQMWFTAFYNDLECCNSWPVILWAINRPPIWLGFALVEPCLKNVCYLTPTGFSSVLCDLLHHWSVVFCTEAIMPFTITFLGLIKPASAGQGLLSLTLSDPERSKSSSLRFQVVGDL